MFVGIATIEIYIPEVHSLKEKRRVLKKIIDNVKNNFPISIAEVEGHDLWQKAVVGLAMVSGDRVVIDKIFQKIGIFIEELNLCEITSFDKEIFSW